MAIKAGNFVIVGNAATPSVETEGAVEVKIENKIVHMEDGTVIHNGQPKKFNKKMSAYMIDMLTSEE
jgi:ABC-type arginine transport system ATPase subunit